MVGSESQARGDEPAEFSPDRPVLNGACAICTASPLICMVCPNAVSIPAHLPKQLALAQVLVNAAAALYGTPRDGQYDVHLFRVRSLIEQATPAEIDQARADITADDIENAERLLRREFDAW